jgi:hypothetical protein
MKCSECMGNGNCSYNIMLPYLATHFGSVPLEKPEAKYVSIDKCLLREILDLWELGIKTTGCCCGHGDSSRSFIGVKRGYEDRMRRMGYVERRNECDADDRSEFCPKTKMVYSDNIDKGFNWWDNATN